MKVWALDKVTRLEPELLVDRYNTRPVWQPPAEVLEASFCPAEIDHCLRGEAVLPVYCMVVPRGASRAADPASQSRQRRRYAAGARGFIPPYRLEL